MPATIATAGLSRRNLYDPAQSELEARQRGIAAVLEEWLQTRPLPAGNTAERDASDACRKSAAPQPVLSEVLSEAA